MAKLVLLRHGQSLYNLEGRFTGWMDIDLSERGKAEAGEAGWLMKSSGLTFDIAFTSVLKRAIRTLWIVLDEMDLMWIPALPCWRLNERFYGDLQGSSKKEVEERYGKEQVRRWRRGFFERPPAVEAGDERYPGLDPRYRDLPLSLMPRTESLQDTQERVLPFWQALIGPELEKGKNVLVVSHGNTIRALAKHLENISDEDIEKVEIGTAEPLVYELDDQMCLVGRSYLGSASISGKK
jgi:2,3-bisphosphoglycerate-dependent phosphoglycerate mutase